MFLYENEIDSVCVCFLFNWGLHVYFFIPWNIIMLITSFMSGEGRIGGQVLHWREKTILIILYLKGKKNPAICITPKSVRLTSRRRCAYETLWMVFPLKTRLLGRWSKEWVVGKKSWEILFFAVTLFSRQDWGSGISQLDRTLALFPLVGPETPCISLSSCRGGERRRPV